MSSLSSNLYKFGHLVNNKLVKIYVFQGKDAASIDAAAAAAANETNEEGVEIVYIKENQIHLDDTIEIIKKKLLIELLKDKINISFYELYLFAKHYEEINPLTVFQELTNNGKNELTQEKLAQYLVNMSDKKTLNEDKSEYTYEDFQALFSEEGEKTLINKPVGQKFLALPNSSIINYVVNPYDLTRATSDLAKPILDKLITTTNQSLLLSIGAIQENLI